jgi:hypothetical protein
MLFIITKAIAEVMPTMKTPDSAGFYTASGLPERRQDFFVPE